MRVRAGLRRRGRELPGPVAPGEALARVSGVRVRLGGREVLAGVDMTVRAGEVLALVGPNGAGKSTLLSVLAGDLAPETGVGTDTGGGAGGRAKTGAGTETRSGAGDGAGTSGGAGAGHGVWIAGRLAGDWSAPELALRRAVLPQAATLAFPFPVVEVVRMGRAPWAGTAREERDEEVVAGAMAATEVAAFAGRPFPSLSGGERARVALARVLAQEAPLMLLDEPTAALDLRHQELVLRLCRERAAAGHAVVVVLHDLGLAAAYADRVAVLHDGRVAADGPPAEVLRDELLTGVYRQPVEVLAHPRTGAPLVLPRRDGPTTG
ncbi:heme ABC transporter ATP-binding protein [Streptomyces pyxinae]